MKKKIKKTFNWRTEQHPCNTEGCERMANPGFKMCIHCQRKLSQFRIGITGKSNGNGIKYSKRIS